MNRLFSIIVPVYKVETYLEKCVNSILSQTYKDYELILVDDGSPDSCPQMCDNFAERDNRIKVLHKKNGGQSSARNVGIDNACGEYLVFIDSDDYWCDEHLLENLHNRVTEYQEDIILYGCKIQHQDNTFETTRSSYDINLINLHDKNQTLDALFAQGNFPGAAWIYTIRKSVLDKYNIRFTEGVSAEDFEWVVNSLILSKSIGAVDGVQYVYVKHEGSVTGTAKLAHIKGTCNAIKRYNELGQRYSAIDKFIARIYLLALMSYNNLSKEDKHKSASLLYKYSTTLKDAGQNHYYWFIKICGLRLSSFAIRKAYNIVR